MFTMFLVALTGCVDPNTTDTADTAVNPAEYAAVQVVPTIHGEPQDGYAIIVQDGKDIPVATGETADVKVGEDFTVLVGQRQFVDRDGGPLLPLGEEFWYSPPITDKFDDLPSDVQAIERPLSLHIQGAEVYCDMMFWDYDEDVLDYKGAPGEPEYDRGPYDLQTVDAATYSYEDEDFNTFVLQGAELKSYGPGGSEFLSEDGVMVMIDDQLYIQNEDGEEHFITEWGVNGAQLTVTIVREDEMVFTSTCTGLDITRAAE